jgi:hypothetical protein
MIKKDEKQGSFIILGRARIQTVDIKRIINASFYSPSQFRFF